MIVVEVLGRRGEVVQQLRLALLPATIGRAWSNDVVLSDPTVDPHHARLVRDESGAAWIEDLGSVNGMRAAESSPRVPRIGVNGLTAVRLGRTSLRLVGADHPVPPAIPEIVPTGTLAALLGSTRAMLIALGAALAFAVLGLWLNSYDTASTKAIWTTSVGLAAVLVAWAGIWSLIGRFRVHQFRFLAHLAVIAVGIVTLYLLALEQSALDFLLPDVRVLFWANEIAGFVMLIAIFAAHLGLVSQARRPRRVVIAALITATILGLSLLPSSSSLHGHDTVELGDAIAPLPASLVPARELEVYVNGLEELKQDIDALAKERT